MRFALVPFLAFTIVACSGGDSSSGGLGGNGLTIASIASPGGLWTGIDSEGNSVELLVSEDGIFFILAGPLELQMGAGELTVTGSESLRGVVVLPNEFASSEVTSASDCKLTGMIEERVSLTLDVRCRDSQLAGDLTTLSLAYDVRYDRNSSLSIVAGNFDHFRNGSVLNIAGDGMVFSQDGASCLTNGRITVLNNAYNVYGMELQFYGCPGLDSGVNGETFSGLALLDNTVTPERLTFALANSSSDQYITILSWADRR